MHRCGKADAIQMWLLMWLLMWLSARQGKQHVTQAKRCSSSLFFSLERLAGQPKEQRSLSHMAAPSKLAA